LARRLGGPQNRSGRGGEEKNSQPPPGIELRTPIVQPVVQRYTDRTVTALMNLYNWKKKVFIFYNTHYRGVV
jgi:hypothetical protein